MFTLVIGGSGSGKSAYAEALTEHLGTRRVYIAAMRPWDAECERRIARHQRQRAGRGYVTMERYTDLSDLELPAYSSVLLECLSNLLANELYTPEGRGGDAVLAGVLFLREKCEHLTVVTNEVFSGGADYNPETLAYLRTLADINRTLARTADNVVEIVAGLPNVLKGVNPV